ncbi:MAG TPA: OmpA family protein, partial [Myxococcaceae bacterium]|nr:OmpA family protein [Myxococcaceae bacterium]
RLDEVAEALKKTQSPLVIEGHTDSQGPEEVNEELSQLRAESVRDYLAEKGVDSARVRTTGLGESRPVASNKNPEGRANNRRVEIVIERGIGGAGQQQEPVPDAPQPAAPQPAAPAPAPAPQTGQSPGQIPQPVPTP